MSTKPMQAPTEAEFRRFAPRASNAYISAFLNGWSSIQAAGINTPLRWCHFVAQCHHETGGFTIVREQTTWSAQRMCELWPHRFKMTDPVFRARYAMCRGEDRELKLAELAYNGNDLAESLGNCEEGDGYAYRGGGIFQGTGRSWYRAAGEAIGHDLEGSPDLIENPAVSLQAALWYWRKKNLNQFADGNNLRAVGNAINRGNAYSKHEPIGAAGRKASFDRAWAVWGTGAIATTTNLDVGSSGAEVKAVQLRLQELRYAVGAADGVFGPETRRGIAAFKADWAAERGTPLEPGSAVGPLTRAALAEADPVERAERSQATAKDLIEAGSTEMKAGQEMKAVGKGVVAIGAAGAAAQTGIAETASGWFGWIPSFQSAVAPAIDGLRWASSHLVFVAMIGVGLLVYYRGDVVQRARLLAHRLGFNLGR